MNCSSCQTKLEPVSETPQRRHDDWTVQYWDSLGIEFLGGFGMYFDDLLYRRRDFIAVICKSCANSLLEQNPWIKNIIIKEMDESRINL